MNFQDVYKTLTEDIKFLFNNMGDTLNYDKTFRAKVVDTKSSNKFIVSYKNRNYIVKCYGKVKIGDNVWVCAPGNNWDELYIHAYQPDSVITQVNGVKGSAESSYKSGYVNIKPEDIGLENINNTSDLDKPLSKAQQKAIDEKVSVSNGDVSDTKISQLQDFAEFSFPIPNDGEKLSVIIGKSKRFFKDFILYKKNMDVNQIGIINNYIDDIVNLSPNDLICKMGAGWNLYNTMECWHNDYTTEDTSHWETLWGNPITTIEMIKEVKKKGFNTIRIPISWRSNLNSDSTIMNSWFNRIEEIINYVLDCNMFCIINVHHDTGVDGTLTANLSKVYETMYHLENLWKQIATRFEKYDYRLIFEGFNEIVNPNAKDVWYGDPDSYKAVNMLNQIFVDTVRKVPGNENRFLLCAPYGAQYQEGPISAFELPKDTAKGKIIARLNMYHNDKQNLYKSTYTIERYFSSKGIACIVTELGILDNNKTMKENDKAKLIESQVKQFRKMGLGCIIWEGNLNRSTLVWNNDIEVESFIENYRRTKKQVQLLDESIDLMDINNYRLGEYSFSSGIYNECNGKISFITYVVPAYEKYVVTTTVENLLYLITQLDEDYKFVEVAIRGNYGSFEVNNRTRYLGITLYNDNISYSLDDFNTLLKTNNLRIVPHDQAKRIYPDKLYYSKAEVNKLLDEFSARIERLENK
jgi:aryl-phospho-beta-D-glucosidase BglC (GH1 family)